MTWSTQNHLVKMIINVCFFSRGPTSFWQTEETSNWVSVWYIWSGRPKEAILSLSLQWECVSLCFSWFWSGSRDQRLRGQKEVFYWNSLLVSPNSLTFSWNCLLYLQPFWHFSAVFFRHFLVFIFMVEQCTSCLFSKSLIMWMLLNWWFPAL